MTRLIRIVAIVLLMTGAFQIAICAADCNCFLPPASQMSSNSLSRGDADGCLCCAHLARVAGLIQVPGPLFELFSFLPPSPPIPELATLDVYRPPRS